MNRKKAERESERVRQLELEALQRQLTEIKKELPRLGKIEDELPTRRRKRSVWPKCYNGCRRKSRRPRNWLKNARAAYLISKKAAVRT